MKEALNLKSVKSDESDVTARSRDVKVSFLQGVPVCRVLPAVRDGCTSPMGWLQLVFQKKVYSYHSLLCFSGLNEVESVCQKRQADLFVKGTVCGSKLLQWFMIFSLEKARG